MTKQLIKQNPIQTIAIIVISFFAHVAYAAEDNSIFKVGSDYQLVEKIETQQHQQLSELETISNIEIFYWYGCESCFHVEAAILEFAQNNPELTIRRTPLIARPAWRQQAYIQALMSQLSETEELPSILEIYQQCLLDCAVLKNLDAIILWFTKRMPEQDFNLIEQKQIWSQEKIFKKRSKIFSITQVPTIIINERYKVDANQAKTAKRLVEIMEFLLAK